MRERAVLKETGLILIILLLLAAALAVDWQFYLTRQEAAASFGNIQRVFWLMSVSRLVTAVSLMILIWLIVMRQQGGFVVSLLCLLLGLLIVLHLPLNYIFSSLSLFRLFEFPFGSVTFGNSRFSEVGAMLVVIGVWRAGQLFLQRRHVND